MALTFALNDAQRTAVEHPPGPILVVAGAGSGKTRVLTARIARLLDEGVEPRSVVAFTFTNRAAREMRDRVERAVGDRARGLWIGTFHGTAVRILRREAAALDFTPDFAIYDREDQENLVRETIGRLALPETTFRVGPVLARISDAKNALVSPDEMARVAVDFRAKAIADCYRLYQRELRRAGALDFDDLIGETVRLLQERPEARQRYAGRFRHVLVDEYQDTNHAQFLLVEALSSVHRDLFAVGDDDQSIYGWRGASLSNVLDFEAAFPDARVLRLEQNYRSTATILAAANAVIANNRERKGKTLWCDREEGAALRFVLAEDETGEARRVAALLAERVRRGSALGDCAVLYRTNAQSRALETELRRALIPYEIVGGVSFYQRREIKDLLAYLRLAVQPADGVAFWRVWNTPRRGLGAAVRARVERRMGERGAAPLAALRSLVDDGGLTGAARAGAMDFLAVVDDLAGRRQGPVDALLVLLLERTGYLDALGEGGDAADRRANVAELGNAATAFAGLDAGLTDFLAEAALVSDVDLMGESADRVLLLTVHNAKGLEFPVVVVAGLEEGLFPHASSLEDARQLEEERRLFYVALTRARDEVLLTAAAYRRRADGARGGAVSRFVAEIPPSILEHEDARPAWTAERERARTGSRHAALDRPPLRASARRHRALGREVYHESFGRGVVVDAEGDGTDARFTVRFADRVRKVLGRFLEGGGHGD